MATGFPVHTSTILQTAKSKAAALRAQANSSFDRTRSAIALWRHSILPAFLSGATIVPFTPACIAAIEVVQNNVLRFITSASQSASAAALRGVFNWSTVQSEINTQKLTYWQKMLRMPDCRWPKVCLQEMLRSPHPYEWQEEIRELQNKYQISPLAFSHKTQWGSAIRQHIKKHSYNQWYQYVTTKPELSLFRPIPDGDAAFHYTKKKHSTLTLLMRISDYWSITRKQKMPSCTLCDAESQC